jgi:hypothetical protein
MIKITRAIMAMTIKTPTPTPKLKIPSTTSQLEKVRSIRSSMFIFNNLFMAFLFLIFI